MGWIPSKSGLRDESNKLGALTFFQLFCPCFERNQKHGFEASRVTEHNMLIRLFRILNLSNYRCYKKAVKITKSKLQAWVAAMWKKWCSHKIWTPTPAFKRNMFSWAKISNLKEKPQSRIQPESCQKLSAVPSLRHVWQSWGAVQESADRWWLHS